MKDRPSTELATEQPRRWSALAAVIIGVGWLLRAWQLAVNPSLWLDELAVVRNIVLLPLDRLLFSPLEYAQIAPIGFLSTGWILSSAFPDQDWVVRVVPFVSSLATLPVVYFLCRRVLGARPALVAVGLVALSPSMIALGAVAKPYASDVFVTAALMLGAVKIVQGDVDRPSTLAGYGLMGGLLLFFSFPGVLVAFALALAVSVSWAIERPPGWLRRTFGLGLPLGACACAVTAVVLRTRSAETASYMTEYWAEGFPSSALTAPVWLGGQFVELYEAAFISPYPWTGNTWFWPAVLLGVSMVGACALVARQPRAAIIILAPLAVAVLAAAAHLYPLAHRLSLFLTPALALLTIAGSVTLAEAASRRFGSMPRIAFATPLVIVALALAISRPPFLLEHTRPLIQKVAEERRPTDAVYSFYAANQAFDYYGPRLGLGDWVPGECARGRTRAYFRQLDALRGQSRVWVVFTHAIPRLGEVEAILGYLRTIGVEKRALLGQMDDLQTSAYLFDLSDPKRLKRAAADDYVFEPGAPVEPRFVCGRDNASRWERPQVAEGRDPMLPSG